MTEQQALIIEIKKLNKHLNTLNNPWKSAFHSFRSGFFQSLGSLIGTLVVTVLVVYFLSRLSLTQRLLEILQQSSPGLKTF